MRAAIIEEREDLGFQVLTVGTGTTVSPQQSPLISRPHLDKLEPHHRDSPRLGQTIRG